MTLSEIKAAVAGLLARATTADEQLRAEVTALNARLDGEVKTLTESLAAATAENSKLQTVLTEASAKLTKLDADLAAANLKLTETQAATNNAIAQTGVNLADLPAGTSAPATTASVGILAQYHALKDPQERMEFYRKNRDAFDAAHRASLKQ